MRDFGKLLRTYRNECFDPDFPGRRLTQERLGELLGREMDIQGGYSGAAVSDWERDKSKIHADQRLVLISLIKILHECGGIQTPSEANYFLASGNYRALDSEEILETSFTVQTDPQLKEPTAATAGLGEPHRFLWSLLEKVFPASYDELQILLDESKKGPVPYWPRFLVALFRRSTDDFTALKLVRPVIWMWVWLVTWALIAPSLHWPFAGRESAALAMKLYVLGSLIGPSLISLLTETRLDGFWKEHGLANAPVTRLYTYQGAGIGFHIGYFVVFAINLLAYYLNLRFSIWFELPATTAMIVLGYVSARLVPFNLWRAFGRLHLADGAIFFVFVLLSPMWGLFFYEFNALLLNSFVGGVTILAAITLFILIAAWQQYRSVFS